MSETYVATPPPSITRTVIPTRSVVTVCAVFFLKTNIRTPTSIKKAAETAAAAKRQDEQNAVLKFQQMREEQKRLLVEKKQQRIDEAKQHEAKVYRDNGMYKELTLL